MTKIFQDKRRDITFFLRIHILFWAALTVTYIILSLTIRYGGYGLFFGGIIAGGLWGHFWHIMLTQSPQAKWLPKNSVYYVIATFIMVGILIISVIFLPLPAI